VREEKQEGKFLAQTLLQVREEEEGDFLAQTLG
jgi:hypothetical protein